MWLGFYTRILIVASSLTRMFVALVEVDNDSNVLLGFKDDDVDPDYVLSELHRRVLTYNIKEIEKIVYKNGEKLTYKVG
jgi:hypothetical protein